MLTGKFQWFAYFALFFILARADGEGNDMAMTEGGDTEHTCFPPLWHGMHEDNWPLAGIKIGNLKSKPIYKLMVKGLEGGNYTAGKSYVVSLIVHSEHRKSKSFRAFYLTLDNDDSKCAISNSTFTTSTRKNGMTVIAKADCANLLVVEGTSDMTRSRGIKWVAPLCGCVTIRATLKNAERILFYDLGSEEIDDKYEVLTKKICKHE